MRFSHYLLSEKIKVSKLEDQPVPEKEDDKKDKSDKEVIDLTDKNQTDTASDENNSDKDQSENSSDEKTDEKENPDKQGLIRTIKGAHLIYKRKNGDGTFSELWIYSIHKGLKDEFAIRNAILDGTDIDQKTGQSKDEKQTYDLWTCNDRQMMKISGLTN